MLFTRGLDGEVVWKDGAGRDKKQYGKPRMKPTETRPPTLREKTLGAVLWKCYEFLYNKGYENINFHMKLDEQGFTLSGTTTKGGAIKARLFGQRPKGKFLVWP